MQILYTHIQSNLVYMFLVSSTLQLAFRRNSMWLRGPKCRCMLNRHAHDTCVRHTWGGGSGLVLSSLRTTNRESRFRKAAALWEKTLVYLPPALSVSSVSSVSSVGSVGSVGWIMSDFWNSSSANSRLLKSDRSWTKPTRGFSLRQFAQYDVVHIWMI